MSLIDSSYALIAPTTRMIGTIIPDCAVQERQVDRVQLTQHPVETGAAITDHAFRFGADLTMLIGFSNSTAKTEGWVQQAYQTCLALKDARQPFNVTTGKRQYQNMLITQLETETDVTTEYTLNITVTMQEVILVSTSTSGGSASSTAAAAASDPSDQAVPQSTYALDSSGNVVLGSADGAPTFAQTQSSIVGANDFSTIQGGEGFSTVPLSTDSGTAFNNDAAASAAQKTQDSAQDYNEFGVGNGPLG